MKNIISLLFFLTFTAIAADVRWTFTDFTTSPQAVKRVSITPIAAYGVNATSFITGDRLTYTNNSSGSLIVSNVVVGRSYRVEFFGSFVTTTITNNFASDVTGFVEAVDYLAAPLRVDASTVAYSQTAANARFVTQSGLAAGSYAINGVSVTNLNHITIYRSNALPVLFSNDLRSAWAALQNYDTMVIPPGKFYVGRSNLVTTANDVTIRGSGHATKIISWCAGPAIIPSTNNFTLDSVHLTYAFLPMQEYLVETEEESWSQGIGVPSPGVASAMYGDSTLCARAITNLLILNCTITSQADNLALYTNSFVNGIAKNTVFEYAWDCTVGAALVTNWMTFDDCSFIYLGAIFTNTGGSVLGASPRIVRTGSNQRYYFNNCFGWQVASVIQLWDTGSSVVNGGGWIARPLTGSWSFNASDIEGSTTVNSVHYSSSGSYSKTNTASFSYHEPTTWPTSGQLRTNGAARTLACINFKMATDLAAGQSDITVTRWNLGVKTNFSVISIVDDVGGFVRFSPIVFPLSPNEIWSWTAVETGDVLETSINDGSNTSQIFGL